ncbi:hypothetical protein ACFORH_38915 [Amycolatopsis roodepoortensis]|uniref:Uncharacterized protein n=1 Tax=Amycolatopsis roodepoortensis TaxID=700274 RepID=A0ABR9LIH2_9PSEU|nr:hypothetical protein [Amycolatopsis roodepoortensis]MBE1580486.1 hypothetical protein [Amycolatopsis roodepoortensis]
MSEPTTQEPDDEVIQPASPVKADPVMQPGSAERVPLVVAGASGGVGTSAVARLLDGRDAGVWRTDNLGPLIMPDVLVAGVSVQSMTRARRALTMLSLLGGRPLLIVVGDGRGRAPADSRALLTLLGPLVQDVVHLPYTRAWRNCTSPYGLTPPSGRAFRRAVTRAREACALPPLALPTIRRR